MATRSHGNKCYNFFKIFLDWGIGGWGGTKKTDKMRKVHVSFLIESEKSEKEERDFKPHGLNNARQKLLNYSSQFA